MRLSDRQGFRRGARIVPGFVSAEFKRRLAALRGASNVSPNNRIATPRFWHTGDAIAIVISLGMFAILCGLRCG